MPKRVVTSVTTSVSIAGDTGGDARSAQQPTSKGAREIFPRISPHKVMHMDASAAQKLMVDVDAAYTKLKAMLPQAASQSAASHQPSAALTHNDEKPKKPKIEASPSFADPATVSTHQHPRLATRFCRAPLLGFSPPPCPTQVAAKGNKKNRGSDFQFEDGALMMNIVTPDNTPPKPPPAKVEGAHPERVMRGKMFDDPPTSPHY